MAGANDSQNNDAPSSVLTVDVNETLRQDADAIAQSRNLSEQQKQPPAKIAGYEIVRCLGEGAFGSVWLAHETNTGKQVAVKFYSHRRGLDWSLLNREVEKLAVLYTSRHIVRLLDVGWDADPPYYVMEFLENGSLGGMLSDGRLPPHEVVRIAKSVLHALVHAHGSGILHCDLKPANVLLDADFEPRICDFGQSRLSDEQSPALGTVYYMAPEQSDLQAVPDARWDVYAVGAIMYQMLCGEPPHRTPESERQFRDLDTLKARLEGYRRLVTESPKPTAHRKAPGVDKRLADIVDRCLQADPQKRFPNAQAVLDSLEQRDRMRARRPLVLLGIIGPALLLLAMAYSVYNVMQKAESKARNDITARALESDVLPARILSESLNRELEDRQLGMARIAAQEEFREAVSEADIGKSWPERRRILQSLEDHKREVDRTRARLNRSRDTSWFVTDAEGWQIWRHPPSLKTLGENYSHRDYFHAHGTEYERDAVPEDISPIRKPHISLAFRSEATNKFMVAIAVPIWDAAHEEVIGVLARTTHLGDLLEDYGKEIRGTEDTSVRRVLALIQSRTGRLLDHPWLSGDRPKQLSDADFEKLVLSERFTQDLQHLEEDARSSGSDVFRDENYRDPVGAESFAPEEYGGLWLAAFSPVGGTDWVAIVQERKSAAQQPVDDMYADLTRSGVWALLVSCALIGILWYFVMRALNDPSPRYSPARNDSTADG